MLKRLSIVKVSVVLVFTASAGMVHAQSCLHEPPASSYMQIFGFVQGQGIVPPGATCYCGGAEPEGETDCWIAIHSKYEDCPDCDSLSQPPLASAPIRLTTGNAYITEKDIRIPGLGGGLALVRTWNSLMRQSLSSIGLFGPNWRSTYEERIYVDNDNTVGYARSDGSVWNFVLGASTTFTPPTPPNTLFTYRVDAPGNATAALFYSSSVWTLIVKNGEQRTFDATSGNLLTITDRNGNTTQLTYDSSYRLTTVTDAASRHLYFSYASPSSYLVTGVSSDAGVSLSYSYDGQGRLSQYVKPDQTTVSFQYGASNPILITAVLDQNNKILESHTYDSLGRGLTSSKANGVEAVTVTYPPGSIAVP